MPWPPPPAGKGRGPVGTRARPGKCVLSCKRCDVVTNSGAEGQQQGQGVQRPTGNRRLIS